VIRETISSTPQPTEDSWVDERAALRDRYLASFRENIMILDVCWAAGQRYSVWKRWLRGPAVIKDGSAADVAFRDLLLSGKSPIDYREQKRPKGWK
jgi:hypothetical protein